MRGEILSARRVAPSILSADFARLGAEVREVIDAGARIIHVDVMDGHFVPAISFGAVVVGALADQVHAAGAILDVHLMIERPERHVSDFAKAGADSITVHAEATPHLHYALAAIRDAGCVAGVALCPASALAILDDVARQMVDVALCMTVNPGWSAQEFIPACLGKIERMRAALPPEVALEVDGGIHAQTVGPCAQAGANLFVAGSGVFGSGDPAGAYAELARAAGAS